MTTKNLTLAESLTGAQDLLEASNAFTGTSLLEVGEAIANSETDKEVTAALDISAVKAMMILSDQDVLFEVNDGAGAGGSESLLAGVPYVWFSTSYFTNKFSVDWTSVFITNASGDTANIQILALTDATPS